MLACWHFDISVSLMFLTRAENKTVKIKLCINSSRTSDRIYGALAHQRSLLLLRSASPSWSPTVWLGVQYNRALAQCVDHGLLKSVPEAGWLRQCSDPWQETHTLTLTYECQKSYRVLFICFICISLADSSGKRCCTRILRGAVLQGPTAAIVRYWILGLYFCWWRSVLHILCTKSGNLKYKSKMGKQTIVQTQFKKNEIKNSLISQIGGSQSTCGPEVAN